MYCLCARAFQNEISLGPYFLGPTADWFENNAQTIKILLRNSPEVKIERRFADFTEPYSSLLRILVKSVRRLP